ncbi:SDR family oxidoreductase [Flagellimonas zhangzhouensis]|uniref:Putative NADH-flavin reductase n=1 Tax=Flagellimonas zhangzhouensis TaxID=1073328 RepID=A0A1H2YLT5_9FLAO|nr:SDR family oxidoreductase [Allomuricauda zhangzhouensis]SDR01974.1 Putative NADH-flavin reductase [Allomuricauda zhangzhouensis]SDX05961.1 Putative NADH-flavin reductase [Allomuricauda zhangzhouensis]
MKVIIIGANGKVGRLIAQKMSTSHDFEPTALIRKEEQKEYFDSIGVPSIVESIESQQETIAKAIKGFDAVIFSAGSGGATGADKTIEVDLFGAVKSIEAAKANGISRFVMVGAALSDNPESWQPASMKPYYIAKHLADKELKRSGLDYTILRPVLLTDDEKAGKIRIESDPNLLNNEIPRAAVAETILEVLPNEKTFGKVMEMSAGNLEIKEAIAQFVG